MKITPVFVALLVLTIAVGCDAPATHESSAKPPETAAQKAANDKAFELCRQKLVKAQKLDVLRDLKADLPPVVVVGPTYMQMPFDAREGFAQTVNCFLMGGSTDAISFDLLDYKTHKVVGSWSYGHLEAAE